MRVRTCLSPVNFASSEVFLHLGAAFGQQELRVFLEEGGTDKDNTDKLKLDNVGDDVTGEFFSLRLEAKNSDDKPTDDKVGNE